MCLYTSQPKPYIAEEDIKVFKVLLFDFYKNKWVTPILLKDIKFDKVLNAEKLTEESLFPNYSYTIMKIETGFFHSFTDKIEAEKFIISFFTEEDNEIYEKLEVFDAVIPKGATYYIGNDNDICSDKLIILSKV